MLGIAAIGGSGLCIWAVSTQHDFLQLDPRPYGDGCALSVQQQGKCGGYSKEEATTSTGNKSLYFSRHRRAVTG